MFKDVSSNLVEKIYNLADFFHTSRIKNFYNKLDFDLVIDVGSHKGEFINLVIDEKTPIYSFEPQSSVRETLLANTKSKNVLDYFDCALSDSSGKIDLIINNLSSTSSIKKSNSDSLWIKLKTFLLGGELYHGKETVDVKTLDEVFIDRLDKNSKILIKIDVEGAEREVLLGGRQLFQKFNICYVQIESANYQIYDQNTQKSPKQILEDYGFEVKKKFIFPLLNFTDLVFSKKRSINN